jgi:hypothetical protein
LFVPWQTALASFDTSDTADFDCSVGLTINEFLVEPAAGVDGDANCDGVTDASDDQFIEIVNASDTSVNMSGYELRIGGPTGTTITLPTLPVTLDDGEMIVLFSGGTPDFDGSTATGDHCVDVDIDTAYFQTTTGDFGDSALNLNPAGDVIELFTDTGCLVDRVTWSGSLTDDGTSWTRALQGSKDSGWTPHDGHFLNTDGVAQSPGLGANLLSTTVNSDGDDLPDGIDCTPNGDPDYPSSFGDGVEYINGADDDCDGSLDPAEVDADGDGYVSGSADPFGWSSDATTSAPTGYDDCDDTEASVNPGATEVCDGVDTDCSGTYPATEDDNDGDGFVDCPATEVASPWLGTVPPDGGGDC